MPRLLLAAAIAVPLVAPVPASAQAMASGAAIVRVPPVAVMAVEPVSASAASDVRARRSSSWRVEESVRIHVRANHGWQVVVSSPVEAGGTLWIRVSGEAGAGEFQPVEPGAEVAVAVGDRGESEVRLDYRWEGADTAAPLTYTLASR